MWPSSFLATTTLNLTEEAALAIHFKQISTCRSDGRFIVDLLLEKLGDSREVASKRLLVLEDKFPKKPRLRKVYAKFINEYLTLRHIKPLRGRNKVTCFFQLQRVVHYSSSDKDHSELMSIGTVDQ